MKRPMVALVAVGLLLSAPQMAQADEPLPAPALKMVWSPSKAFHAVMDPRTNVTTVYRLDASGQKIKIWSMRGWFRVAALANDGDHLVTGHDGMNLLDRNHKRDEVMLSFFRRGALINRITLDGLIRDRSKLRPTTSHMFWGNYLGFDDRGRYVVETVENRTIRFDVTTGRPARQ